MNAQCQYIFTTDIGTFIKHENHSYPPSLRASGTLRTGTKSDLMPCLIKPLAGQACTPAVPCDADSASVEGKFMEQIEFSDFDSEVDSKLNVLEVLSEPTLDKTLPTTAVPERENEPLPSFDCTVLDGMAIPHLLNQYGCTTFNDFANNVFLPYISKQLVSTHRFDIDCDSYFEGSLKEFTRENRGKGVRRKVEKNTYKDSSQVARVFNRIRKQEVCTKSQNQNSFE